MRMRQQAEVAVLVERALEGVAPPHHRTVAYVEEIIVTDYLTGVYTNVMLRWKHHLHKPRIDRIVLRKGSHRHTCDAAEDVLAKCHFFADVGMNGRTRREMQTNLMAE